MSMRHSSLLDAVRRRRRQRRSAIRLLNALYGSDRRAAGGRTRCRRLQTAEQNQTQDVSADRGSSPRCSARHRGVRATPSVSATSPAQLLANPAVMKVLLTANGLSDQIGYTALATQALLSNAADPNRWSTSSPTRAGRRSCQTYDFATKGLSVIQTPR